VSRTAFWDQRAVTAGVHLNNFTNTAETDTAAGFHASYSLRYLPPHTDGTYLANPPRVKVLGTLAFEGQPCVNTFVDGHTAALTALSRSEREAMSRELIMHTLKADPYSEPMSFNRSILEHDGDGRVHIAWNAHEPRSFVSDHARGAHSKMTEWINNPNHAYREILRPGTVAIIDNWRVLHGREAVNGRWRTMAGADVSDRALRARWRELMSVAN
jgi:trimethyllysine dioxygenase